MKVYSTDLITTAGAGTEMEVYLFNGNTKIYEDSVLGYLTSRQISKSITFTDAITSKAPNGGVLLLRF